MTYILDDLYNGIDMTSRFVLDLRCHQIIRAFVSIPRIRTRIPPISLSLFLSPNLLSIFLHQHLSLSNLSPYYVILYFYITSLSISTLAPYFSIFLSLYICILNIYHLRHNLQGRIYLITWYLTPAISGDCNYHRASLKSNSRTACRVVVSRHRRVPGLCPKWVKVRIA